jgi:hypothetical protein
MHLNTSGCPSLYSFMGILWNGDVIGCNDWPKWSCVESAANSSSLSICPHCPVFWNVGDAAASDLRLIAQLEKLRSIEPECLQFGIVRV